jgi:hypothetical protein
VKRCPCFNDIAHEQRRFAPQGVHAHRTIGGDRYYFLASQPFDAGAEKRP